jgi:hypothetical protein
MSQLVALSVSIGLLGGVATWLYLTTGLLIWAGFIAWACFFHSGGDNAALKNTIVCNIFGAFCAWIALLLLVNVGALPAPVTVGLTVLVLCLGAHIKAFSVIPASVYGYAATAGYFLLSATAKDNLMALNMANPLILVAVSMALGAVFGLASGKLAGMLKGKA